MSNQINEKESCCDKKLLWNLNHYEFPSDKIYYCERCGNQYDSNFKKIEENPDNLPINFKLL